VELHAEYYIVFPEHKIDNLHAECVFTAAGLSQGWSNQIGEALCMEGDELPSHIRRSKVISNIGKLQNLCVLAQKSLRKQLSDAALSTSPT